MKYKLINIKTKEECICDKVTVDGFDYYISDEIIKIGDINIPSDFSRVTDLSMTSSSDLPIVNERANGYKKVIATNNPNIDIPKVVDEVENIVKVYVEELIDCKSVKEHEKTWISAICHQAIIKFQETQSNSDEDMIEFAEWKVKNLFSIRGDLTGNILWGSNNKEYKDIYTTKELLQLWKNQKTKIIYYE